MTDQAPVSGPAALGDVNADNSRILSLSDSVFAFAMTLMVLQFDTPTPDKVAVSSLARVVLEQWPSLVSYVITFLVIANYWAIHHRTFRYIKANDAGLVWINILFLLCISFLPFPTDVMGEYDHVSFAVVFYSASMAITSLVLTLLWAYVGRQRRLVHDTVDDRLILFSIWRGLGTAGIFLLSIPIAYVNVPWARTSWLLLIGFHYVMAWLYRGDAGSEQM